MFLQSDRSPFRSHALCQRTVGHQSIDKSEHNKPYLSHKERECRRSHLSGHVRSGADHPLRERVGLGTRAEYVAFIAVVSTNGTKVCYLGRGKLVVYTALVADKQNVLALDLVCGETREKGRRGGGGGQERRNRNKRVRANPRSGSACTHVTVNHWRAQRVHVH
jgi:hypothetical protein